MSIVTTRQKEDEMTMLRVLKRLEIASQQYPASYDGLALEFFPGVGASCGWRKVAAIVEKLRDLGFKVASSNSDRSGAWIAKTPIELMPTINRMRDQARRILGRCARMEDWSGDAPSLWQQAVEREPEEDSL